MASLLACVFFCMTSLASAYNNRFIFNGFGRFLCDHYGGLKSVCRPTREVISSVPSNCTELCTSCPEDELWTDIQTFTNPHPATDKNGIGNQTAGNELKMYKKCDGRTPYTVVLKKPFQHSGQLLNISWVFNSGCRRNNEIVFAIFRRNGSECDFSVIAQLQLKRNDINRLLSPKRYGTVKYELLDIERNMMQFEAGDYFGFTWRGSGAVAFSAGDPAEDNIYMAKGNKWKTGDLVSLTTADKLKSRLYSLQWAYIPF